MKRMKKLLAMFLILCIILSQESIVAMASEVGTVATENTIKTVCTGTLGDNNGFKWTYDPITNTLTVTGKDSGLEGKQAEYSRESLFSKLTYNGVDVEFKKIVFYECTFKGSLAGMLAGMDELTSIRFIDCDTSEVTDMSDMFMSCYGLTSLDVSCFDTSSVTNMSGMFFECSYYLESIELGDFDTSKVTDMSSMFAGCWADDIDVSNFDTSKVTDMSSMFFECGADDIDVSNFDTSKVTDMSEMFCQTGITSIDVSNFDTSKVTDMGGMFGGCGSLKFVDVSSFDTSKVTNMHAMFMLCDSLKSVDLSSFNTSRVKDFGAMFAFCYNLVKVNVSHLDTSKANDIKEMFWDCKKLKSLDLSNWNLSKVNSDGCQNFLTGCKSLEVLYSPKCIKKGLSIKLPVKLYDSNNKAVTQITSKQVKKVFTKKGVYSITYKLNGGKNSSKNPLSYKKTTSTIILKNPTRKGYTFKGWYRDSKYKKKITQIKKGSTGSLVLYAKWSPNTYTIKFKGNGATSGKMSSLTKCKYGTTYKLSANKFKRKGYTFVGWSTKANGKGKIYKNKASVKNLTSAKGKTVVLYAQWRKNK